MTKKIMILCAAAACGMSACANVGPLPTQNGNPEITVPRKDLAHVKTELMATMCARGYEPLEDSVNTVAFYTMAMSSVYSSQPQFNVRYSLIQQGSSTHVYAFVGVAMQGGFGQSQSLDLTHGKAGREIQEMLNEL